MFTFLVPIVKFTSAFLLGLSIAIVFSAKGILREATFLSVIFSFVDDRLLTFINRDISIKLYVFFNAYTFLKLLIKVLYLS